MTRSSDVVLSGLSGRTYRFGVFPLDAHFRNMGAVYVFSHRTLDSTGKETHAPVYIGQTGELSAGLFNHKNRSDIKENEANCLCIHIDWDEMLRAKIEKDLMVFYNPPGNN
ncbi:hypothetical protein ACFL4N_06970 [Thermodesulfobacteriota bacterium]